MVDVFEKTANLAKLTFTKEEKNVFKQDFLNMIEFAKMLNDAVNITLQICNKSVMREDVTHEIYSVEAMLSNAPIVSDNYITVPKII